jgi:hypothetical protein
MAYFSITVTVSAISFDVDLIPRDFEKLLHISHIEIANIKFLCIQLFWRKKGWTLDTIFPNVP